MLTGDTLAWIAGGSYAGLTLLLLGGWLRARYLDRREENTSDIPPVTLLVPFRNEAKRLVPLIRSLKNIAAELPHWEIILVDDHSDDDSIALLHTEFSDIPQVIILSLPESVAGKKAALLHGISHSRHSLFITTDADCSLPVSAVKNMARAFSQSVVQMVCGPVVQDSGKGFTARLADLEFLSLIGSGISFWGLGMPILANGAFLGFRQTAFESVNGFGGNEQFPGGDDVFLLQKIRDRFGPKSIHFLTTAADVVTTDGDRSAREFVQRRVRWGAKANAYSFADKAVTLVIFAIHSLMAFSWVFFLAMGQNGYALGLVSIKVVGDLVLLTSVLGRLKQGRLWPFILPASLLHPFYLLFAGLAAISGKYTWKKRNYASR